MDSEDTRQTLRQFARDRDWDQFHTPKNLALALVGEIGELAEHLQWASEKDLVPPLSTEKGQAIGEELADVAIYLIRLADVLHIDLDETVDRKISANALRYPVEEVRGKSSKRP